LPIGIEPLESLLGDVQTTRPLLMASFPSAAHRVAAVTSHTMLGAMFRCPARFMVFDPTLSPLVSGASASADGSGFKAGWPVATQWGSSEHTQAR
jgi:hypothetical protein